ncbi:MAG: flippase-like domain-containing protein [Flavobacteriaceae bacterium]|nr:flippase-like domain-containing protein [Flavobacteriaceae bacterium]MCI5088014.1 flippase-like domain-containing protein [Flavobacteriaceae bacterium]
MKSKLLQVLKTILPIAFGFFLIAYTYTTTSPEDRQLIYKNMSQAPPFWVGLSLFIGLLSHLSRAIRWNYLLAPLGYTPPVKSNLLVILMGYFANLGVPRSGEILRATALRTYEKVPFQKGFGTIITERVIDLFMLFIVVGISLILQTDILVGFFEEKNISWGKLGLIGLAVTGGFGLFIWAVFYSQIAVFKKIKGSIGDLFAGVFSVFKMKHKWAFIGHTFFIWACYVGMFWVIKFTVAETVNLGAEALLVAFVAGAFAMSATNGGIGLYPIAIQKSLAIFGVSAIAGNTFGWIMWISQTALVVVLGGISFLIIPFVSSKTKTDGQT